MTPLDLPRVPRGKQLTGDERAELARQVAAAYEGGAGIRWICVATGRSYGSVQRLLTGAGVRMRPRGGKGRRRQHITRTVRDRIADGTYPPGSLLPPQRRLAAEFGAAACTVREALKPLHAELLTEPDARRGTRVAAPRRTGGGSREVRG